MTWVPLRGVLFSYWGPGEEIWVPLIGVLLGAKAKTLSPLTGVLLGARGRNIVPTHWGIIEGQGPKYGPHSQGYYLGPGAEILSPLTGVLLGARGRNMVPTHRGIIGGQEPKYCPHSQGYYWGPGAEIWSSLTWVLLGPGEEIIMVPTHRNRVHSKQNTNLVKWLVTVSRTWSPGQFRHKWSNDQLNLQLVTCTDLYSIIIYTLYYKDRVGIGQIEIWPRKYNLLYLAVIKVASVLDFHLKVI